MQEIIGFHGTKMSCKDSIIKEEFKIPKKKKKDNHWLGHGIYFFADYELAEWWAETKVKVHRRKYGSEDEPCVIQAVIRADNILNLDNPFKMIQFDDWCHEMAEEIVRKGIILNFDMGDGLRYAKYRERCFWMDQIKEEKKIQVIIYTFTKDNPSYADSHYHINDMGLSYNEKQICVSSNDMIIKKIVVENIGDFGEVIV